ncbi:helix-hairpin-helix domain-containing protein [Tenacibaculum sp. SG-28]|uniref:helix-hairpin-helix domain-containing protein n=1 Tax=Tenacibaculum sp. SG-28 TaxID=754426 RepID=UPI000CF404FC|nr:helix-hairpin-helix domain-containing protein [Tenacibaculum sp. SG-28]PQJ21021.1 hypothetical protein BSU00_08300 [Tenacibaculum sp. SG-28]
MKILKPHFWFYKSQRNGVLLLVLLIICLQLFYIFTDFSSVPSDVLSHEVLALEKHLDSLERLAVEKPVKKRFYFNPNFISDYKGYQLGMSVAQIDRLHTFRAQGKYVNSIEEFKAVTKVSDSLLRIIAPNFKFPDWVVAKKQKERLLHKQEARHHQDLQVLKSKLGDITADINQASAPDIANKAGISLLDAKKIISYRESLQGFTYIEQLKEAPGVSVTALRKTIRSFTIQEKPLIEKINVNTASFKEILSIPYINYQLCKKIVDYREEVAELQNIAELKNINNFPLNKYDRIVLYLKAE